MIFFNCILFAQRSEVDSILQLYKNSTDVKNKVKAGVELVWAYHNESRYDEAISLAYQLLPQVKKDFSKEMLAVLYQRMGNIYESVSVYDTALIYANYAIQLHSELKQPEATAHDYDLKGGIYYNMGQYNNALDHFLSALAVSEKANNKGLTASIYNNIANVYKDLINYRKSYDYRQKAVQMYKEEKDEFSVALIYTNLILDLHDMPDTTFRSLKYNAKMQSDTINKYAGYAYATFKKFNVPAGEAAVLGNIGLWFYVKGMYDTALVCEKKCLEIYRSLDMPHDIGAALGDISMIYNAQKKFNEAVKAGLEAEKFSVSTNNIFAQEQIYRNLYYAFKGLQNCKEALFFHEKWKLLNDSLRDEDEKKAITAKAMNYEFDKRAMADSVAAAELRQTDKMKHENEIAVQKTYTYAGIFGLLLMGVIAVMAIKAYRQKKNDNLIISQQKQIVEEHQKEILDSIHYAKRIQSAILAKPEEIKQYLPESFLLYQPKDIVAGDFYFFETTRDHLFYAAADCTGHGVPGALVSVVCSNALSRCVKEFGITKPGEILDKARELVLETFRKSGQEVKDGMDISLVAIHKSKRQDGDGLTIEWAGAFNPLWYSVNGEMKECRANKQPIGLNENPEPFTTHEVKLEKGSIFYLFTDGYADQFGGPKGKKYKYKKLEETLLSISGRPMHEQSEALIKEFEAWRGNLEQVDDVCIIGVKA